MTQNTEKPDAPPATTEFEWYPLEERVPCKRSGRGVFIDALYLIAVLIGMVLGTVVLNQLLASLMHSFR